MMLMQRTQYELPDRVSYRLAFSEVPSGWYSDTAFPTSNDLGLALCSGRVPNADA